MSEWRRKELWSRRGTGFCVEISRHEVEARDERGPHRWCVYAYVYPEHPLFGKFDGENIFQAATDGLPLHGGATMVRRHLRHENGKVCSWQVGSDYDHLHDAHFTHLDTLERARTVELDAEELFAWLEALACRALHLVPAGRATPPKEGT